MKLLNLGCGNRYNSLWTNVDFMKTGPDVIECNLIKDLPFLDSSYDVVYHSHLLEHMQKQQAMFFMQNCFRVLKSNGIIRVVVPDLEVIARLYLECLNGALSGDSLYADRYQWIILELIDQMVRSVPGGEMLKYWYQNPMPAEEFVVSRAGSEVLNVLHMIRSRPTTYETSSVPQCNDPLSLGNFRMSGEVHQWMYDRYSLRNLLEQVGFVNVRQCRADESLIPEFNSYLLDIEVGGAVRKPDSLFMEAVKP